jgi:hypothetical protein
MFEDENRDNLWLITENHSISEYFWRCLFHQNLVSYYFKNNTTKKKTLYSWKLWISCSRRSQWMRIWNFITNVNRLVHVSFWFWKKLHFLPCKEIISCMFYLKDYQLQWISFWLNQFIQNTYEMEWFSVINHRLSRFSSSNMHEWFSFYGM